MEQRKYGLFTAITTIVGMVIGSGIFFKSAIVLEKTQGSVPQGIIAFCLAAVSIIFGSLSIAQLASRNDTAGGLIEYSGQFLGKKAATAYGWFVGLLYYPSFASVIAWIGGVYVCQLFGWEGTLENQVLVAAVLITLIFCINIYNAKWGGFFEDTATIIKMLPLFAFIIAGLLFGDPAKGINYSVPGAQSAGTWRSALPAILFAFDGWIFVTAICHEIKDSKRNLPLALIISPLMILAVYLAYFVGMSNYLGVETILATGNDHLSLAANQLLGSKIGEKLVILIVSISCMGTVNGVMLTYFRHPYALALRKMMPNSEAYTKVNPKHGVSLRSGFLAYIVTELGLLAHYITQKTNIMKGGDISEIAIIVGYAFLIAIYVSVIQLARKGEIKNKLLGYVCPVLAILGSCVLIWSGFTNPLFPYFIVFSLAIAAAGWIYAEKHPEIQ